MAISSTRDSSKGSSAARQPFDYDAIAEVYDAHRRGRGPFLPALVRLAEESEARRVLELGCGTGNSAGGGVPIPIRSMGTPTGTPRNDDHEEAIEW